MGKEIERKFLVDHDEWNNLQKAPGQHYRQGYLLTDPGKTIRVRMAGVQGFLTIKGKTIGATRSEYEYAIPVGEAKELLDNFSMSELSKVRYTIEFAGNTWEVDEFLDKNVGLIVAEIELEDEAQTFEKPPWVTVEVTDDPRYYNSNLTMNPFVSW